MEKINVNDLNGLEQRNLKIITRVIQEPNPLKFCEACQNLLNEFIGREETIINYNVNTQLLSDQRGAPVIIFIAILQYYASENEFTEYESEIKRANLLIKP